MIRALPWSSVVMTPACCPVNDFAGTPSSPIAIASSDIEIRSPAVSRMSISRADGLLLRARARSISSSVVSPIAETATTTSFPARFVSAIRAATRRMLAASATDEPPYFCTMRPTGRTPAASRGWGGQSLERLRPRTYRNPHPGGHR